MKAAIVIPVLTSRDAVGADALAMAAILDDLGIQTRLFCDSSDGVTSRTWPADRLLEFAGGPSDLVIYHYSTGWPKALEILRRCRGFRVVKYHNITPPEFFRHISPDYESACARGREEIAAVAALGCELYLGDSAFNRSELVEYGVDAARTGSLAPFHRIDEIVRAEGDIDLINALSDGSRNFLMVGRVAPNKGHLDLIDAFSAYVRGYNEPSRLIMIGKIDPRLERYTAVIRERIAAHRLESHVSWINGASETQLKAAYLASHVFMILSEHEGFCVPLIESMAVSTPIIARASTAVPETLGDAGIAWEEKDPWLYASSAARLFADDDLRNDLLERGRQRYRNEFSVDVLRQRFMGFLAPVL